MAVTSGSTHARSERDAHLRPMDELRAITIATILTFELQEAYLDVVHGRDPRFADWLDLVEPSRLTAEV